MIKLMEVFFEWNRPIANEATAKKKKDKVDDKVPSLASLAKAVKPKKEPDPSVQSDPEFLKAVQKGLNHSDEKPDPQAINKAADRITNKFYTNQKQKQTAEPVKPSDQFVPSLAQLAQDAEDETQAQQQPVPQSQNPDLKGMPNFDNMAKPEQQPFGHPDFNDPAVPTNPYASTQGDKDAFKKMANPPEDHPYASKPDFRTATQKAASAVGQGIKKGLASFQKKGSEPEVPKNWEKDTQQQPETSPEDDVQGMPSMSSVAKQADKEGEKSTNGLQGKHWKWKPGQKVDVGFVKGLTVRKVDQYGAQLEHDDGRIYRFVPHRGLRLIQKAPVKDEE